MSKSYYLHVAVDVGKQTLYVNKAFVSEDLTTGSVELTLKIKDALWIHDQEIADELFTFLSSIPKFKNVRILTVHLNGVNNHLH